MLLGTDSRAFGPPFDIITIDIVETLRGPALGRLSFCNAPQAHTERHCQGRSAGQLLDLAWAVLETFFATGEICKDLPVHAEGTAFQRLVWNELRTVRPGTTATYGQIAHRVGSPGAARAVGAACGSNPVAIFIPCHRVLDSRGDLHGYAGGIERKAALLTLEGMRGRTPMLFPTGV
ncbi:MAG: methylated-DNA--[protein]-cysteine S-methyltransferase [Leptolyngbya sp. PLA3]|nr:MAG: methylated-DNA--[protein]-cysteine S-methyltransferase [Cyanobacteria bacterium CYA]MCE7969453.1 methylated-DNA--[protein]-cysteine S-methyltransferase [Leptolyngbya sp. PL-A3]